MHQPFDLSGAVKAAEADKNGIDISKLKPGTGIFVRTENNTYCIKLLDPATGGVRIKGGKHVPEVKDGRLTGSTWGGSMLRTGWIGHQMNMEVFFPGWGTLTTTKVQGVKLVGRGWQFEVEWPRQA